MTDRLRELWQELREHWDDRYWWADHLELRAALIAVITGLIGLVFAWFETRIRSAA